MEFPTGNGQLFVVGGQVNFAVNLFNALDAPEIGGVFNGNLFFTKVLEVVHANFKTNVVEGV